LILLKEAPHGRLISACARAGIYIALHQCLALRWSPIVRFLPVRHGHQPLPGSQQPAAAKSPMS
jgi:hypothetical protein